jgi:hypothetical protein
MRLNRVYLYLQYSGCVRKGVAIVSNDGFSDGVGNECPSWLSFSNSCARGAWHNVFRVEESTWAQFVSTANSSDRTGLAPFSGVHFHQQ